MTSPGYVSHAEANRRQLVWLVALFLLAFEMIGGLAAAPIIIWFDPGDFILLNPVGYFAHYALPMAGVCLGIFAWHYSRHAETLIEAHGVSLVSRIDEPRFVDIAEAQCLALGVRVPRFGMIEVLEANAFSVGEGPARGLIAVTRGLIDQLDDEELAAVLAHEASHIRHGDTKLLSANHALMRTAVILQVNNPLRIEDKWQLLLIVLLPPLLLVLLLSGMLTMASMSLARMARRALKLSRDHIADGEAVRVTHRPDALHSALMTVGGKGAFAGSAALDDMLFDGAADVEGGTHPAVVDRLHAISALGRTLMQPGRPRRDTREDALRPNAPPVARFGRKVNAAAFIPKPRTDERRRTPPRRLTRPEAAQLMMRDWPAYRQYLKELVVWYEWREEDHRDIFGVKPAMRGPLLATIALALVIHWPRDGDFRSFAGMLLPIGYAQADDAGARMAASEAATEAVIDESAAPAPPSAKFGDFVIKGSAEAEARAKADTASSTGGKVP